MDDLLRDFLTEASESLTVLDGELVRFEQDPSDQEILQNIFRLMHTIKGTSGFLDLPRLEGVAHAGEDILGKYRDGELNVTPSSVTLILAAIDRIREILGHLEEHNVEPEGNDQELITELRAIAEGTSAGDEVPVAAEPEAEAEAEQDLEPGNDGPVFSEDGIPMAAELLAEVEAAQSQGTRAATPEELKVAMEEDRKAGSEGSEAEAKTPEASRSSQKDTPLSAQSIRVNVDVLENLMTLVSEMVLTRNQLLQMVRNYDDSEFNAPLQRLNLITSDLQEGVMKTRMQPIGNAWSTLPRVVRDLALDVGKKVEVEMKGAETELDRQVLELIKDPLTHMVRNAVDHGLESSEQRAETGKPECGKVILNAYHEGGHIIIEISDDGRGLNTDAILAKAVEKGLVADANADDLTDKQIHNFIMQAGFSTAEKVTNVSGRGVGMDVVRSNIEQIGGTIDLVSKAGEGSTFTIKIPLTLAIISALIVESAGLRFAIPQISVLELVLASPKSEASVVTINNSIVLRLRDKLLPLISLHDLLQLDQIADRYIARPSKGIEIEGDLISQEAETDAGIGSDEIIIPPDEGLPEVNPSDDQGRDTEQYIVVCQVGKFTFGIVVDQIFDTEEIVVKPVAPIIRDVAVFSGNTILGDGSVIMILDLNGIAAEVAHLNTVADSEIDRPQNSVAAEQSSVSLLIFKAGSDELKAVPLALVSRLEEINLRDIERSNGAHMVQYRGNLMQLAPLNSSFEWDRDGVCPVLVFADEKRAMGLIIDEIVDIVEEKLTVDVPANGDGSLGTGIINGRATEMIDIHHFLTRLYPDWFIARDVELSDGAVYANKQVLLVDDSQFFRNLFAPMLVSAGYDVISADSAQSALEFRNSGAEFDLIISDIDMPQMNGFEFAQEVRSDDRWRGIPMIAMSGRATERDRQAGKDAGFNDYFAKPEPNLLIQSISATLSTPVEGRP